jgi:hypothetical protein
MSRPSPTVARWPVWRESVRGPVAWQKHDRKSVNFWLRHLDGSYQALDQLSAWARRAVRSVVRGLMAHYNFSTGELYPSVESIAKTAGYGRTYTHWCLKLAKMLGIIEWDRRCDLALNRLTGRYQLAQSTNGYRLRPPDRWAASVGDVLSGTIRDLVVIGRRPPRPTPFVAPPSAAPSAPVSANNSVDSGAVFPPGTDLIQRLREITRKDLMDKHLQATRPKKPPST